MIGHLTLHSEFSFGKCYGFMNRTVNEYSDAGFIGICDNWNTFSAYRMQQACKKHNESLKDWKDGQDENLIINGSRRSIAKTIKPIFGIRVTVCEDATVKNSKTFGRLGQHGTEYIIIAKNRYGLREIFMLTSIGSTNFYYRENVSVCDIENLTENVVVIPTSNVITKRADYYGLHLRNIPSKTKLPTVFVDDNFYPTKKDMPVYECYSGRNREIRTVSQHILTEEEVRYYFPKEAIDNIQVIADSCEHFELELAKPIRHLKDETIEDLIIQGAKKKNIDLSIEPYKSRIEYELEIIKNKDFVDYFLVVADIISWAKERTLVAPGRGSSAGSLICYCLDITDIDPIKYNTIFARFISYNRGGWMYNNNFKGHKEQPFIKKNEIEENIG